MQLGRGNREIVTRSNILYPDVIWLQAPGYLSASGNILAVEWRSSQERTKLLRFWKFVLQIQKEIKVLPTHAAKALAFSVMTEKC